MTKRDSCPWNMWNGVVFVRSCFLLFIGAIDDILEKSSAWEKTIDERGTLLQLWESTREELCGIMDAGLLIRL
jgi:hypothetical protein